jgi:cobalt-zinc-cadmium efflux system outer membrane protein
VLSLSQAVATFRERGFDLLLAEQAAESVRADSIIASSIPNPAVNGAISKSFGYSASQAGQASIGFTAGLSDSAAIEDTLSGKRGLRMTVGRAAYEAAKLSRKDAQRTLEFTLKQAYTQTAQAKALLAFALEVQKTNVDTLTLMKLRYEKGAISEADLAKIETAKLESDQAVDSTTYVLRQNQVLLGFLLGSRKPAPEYDVDEAVLHTPIPDDIAKANRDGLIDRAFQTRPDLAASRHQVERADSSVSLAKRLRFPDIALSAQYSQEGTGDNAVTPPTVSVGLSAPIPILYQQQGEVTKAEADLKAQQITTQKIEAQVVSDVDTAYAALTSAKKLVDRMDSGLIDRATRVRDLVNIQYQKGAASLLEYLDAQRTYIATKVEYIQDLTTYRLALFQLEQALGGNLES